MMKSEALDTLMSFLSKRPDSSKPVLSLFSELDGAITHCDGDKNNFVYVPGNRADRVVLAAHADTVWDVCYCRDLAPELADKLPDMAHVPAIDGEFIVQKGWENWGIGADDRAGCAMLWLLRNSGHSLLITDGEEYGQIGAHYLVDHYPAIAEELNEHRYMIQLDRRNSSDYKTYRLAVTDDFRRFIESHTGFCDAGVKSRTDIVALCTKICGVNFSIGYYNEHTPQEYLSCPDWINTLRIVRRLLEGEQPGFALQE